MKRNYTHMVGLALAGCGWAAAAGGSAEVAPGVNPAAVAEKRTDWSAPVTEMWAKRAQQQQANGGLDVLFVGDSITQLWLHDPRWANGQQVWDKYYVPLKAGNVGVAGDRTENLLWRIREGRMLDGLHPKVVVLLIGINNLTGWGGRSGGDAPENVAAAVKIILEELKSRFPAAKILLLGLFPALAPDNPIRQKIRQVNAQLVTYQDQKQVFFLDFGGKFLKPDGSAPPEMLRDGLHLSAAAYELWATEMTPLLRQLLAP